MEPLVIGDFTELMALVDFCFEIKGTIGRVNQIEGQATCTDFQLLLQADVLILVLSGWNERWIAGEQVPVVLGIVGIVRADHH